MRQNPHVYSLIILSYFVQNVAEGSRLVITPVTDPDKVSMQFIVSNPSLANYPIQSGNQAVSTTIRNGRCSRGKSIPGMEINNYINCFLYRQ